jgi:hypothetical protein
MQQDDVQLQQWFLFFFRQARQQQCVYVWDHEAKYVFLKLIIELLAVAASRLDYTYRRCQ